LSLSLKAKCHPFIARCSVDTGSAESAGKNFPLAIECDGNTYLLMVSLAAVQSGDWILRSCIGVGLED
jgi:hypothetical protein